MNGEGELIELLETQFSLLLYEVRAVHKFDSRPVTKCTCDKWRPAKSARDMFLTRLYVFSVRNSGRQWTPTHTVKAKAVFLSND